MYISFSCYRKDGMMKKSLTIIIFFAFLLTFMYCNSIFQKKEANCVLVGDLTVQEDSGGNTKFLGEIKNVGDAKAFYVKITIITRKANGSVLGVDVGLVILIDFELDVEPGLEPGQTRGFECLTDSPKDWVDSWTYEITWKDESSSLLSH